MRGFLRKAGIIFLLLLLSGCSIGDKPKGDKVSIHDFSAEISNELGVNLHPGVTENDVKLMKEAEIKWVRIDLFWSQIEKEKGKYDFTSTGYDQLNKLLLNNGIRPFYILDYGNKLYEENRSIVTEQGRKAYGNFISAATKRYNRQGAIWEIWNEPNRGFWYPQPSYEEYSLLVKEIAPIIKKNDTSGIIVAPGLGGGITKESIKWLEETFKRGILEDIDAVSIHPYRSDNPESVRNDYQKIRSLISEYTTKKILIISGEWGYPINNLNNSEEKQAEYLIRMFLVNSLEYIPVSIWYDWKNDGPNPDDKEHNFGIMRNDLQPKLSFNAMKTLTHTLSGYKFVGKMQYGGEQDYFLKFVDIKGMQVIVFWTTALNHDVILPFSKGKGKYISMLGTTKDITWDQDRLTLNLSTSPTYLLIK